MEYLKAYTVPQLREIAARMEGITFTTKTRKPELVAAIAARIDYLRGEAQTEDWQRAKVAALPDGSLSVELDSYTLPGTDATWTGTLATEMRKHMHKVDNYRRQNGTDKLTAPQKRRLRKNARRTLGHALPGQS